MMVDQKISLQHIYFGFCIFYSNENSSDITVVLTINENTGTYHIMGQVFLFYVDVSPMSHNIGHCGTTVFTPQSSSNLWLPRPYFNTGNR
jgi:hypothetical protein